MTLSPSQLARLAELRAAVDFDDTIDMEWVGSAWNAERVVTADCTAFYSAAHAAVPLLISETARLRALCVELADLTDKFSHGGNVTTADIMRPAAIRKEVES